MARSHSRPKSAEDKDKDGTLTREWYCFDKDEPVFLKEKAPSPGSKSF